MTGSLPVSAEAHRLLIVASGWIGLTVLRMDDRGLAAAPAPAWRFPARPNLQ